MVSISIIICGDITFLERANKKNLPIPYPKSLGTTASKCDHDTEKEGRRVGSSKLPPTFLGFTHRLRHQIEVFSHPGEDATPLRFAPCSFPQKPLVMRFISLVVGG